MQWHLHTGVTNQSSHLLESCIYDYSNLDDLYGVLHVLLYFFTVLRVLVIVSRLSMIAPVRRSPDLSASRHGGIALRRGGIKAGSVTAIGRSVQRDLLHTLTLTVNAHLTACRSRLLPFRRHIAIHTRS